MKTSQALRAEGAEGQGRGQEAKDEARLLPSRLGWGPAVFLGYTLTWPSPVADLESEHYTPNTRLTRPERHPGDARRR